MTSSGYAWRGLRKDIAEVIVFVSLSALSFQQPLWSVRWVCAWLAVGAQAFSLLLGSLICIALTAELTRLCWDVWWCICFCVFLLFLVLFYLSIFIHLWLIKISFGLEASRNPKPLSTLHLLWLTRMGFLSVCVWLLLLICDKSNLSINSFFRACAQAGTRIFNCPWRDCFGLSFEIIIMCLFLLLFLLCL